MRKLIIVLLAAVCGLFFAPSAGACSADNLALEAILASHHSPLPAYTIEAFAASHPGFSIADYLTVAQCESGMGVTCDYKHNPGSIKGGSVGTPWRDLRIGVSPRGFNVYPNLYTGQRALILLLWTKYQGLLGDWPAFAAVYYGRGVPGEARYLANLEAAHAAIVKEATEYGAKW